MKDIHATEAEVHIKGLKLFSIRFKKQLVVEDDSWLMVNWVLKKEDFS